MDLYLMRHGTALDVGEDGIRRDADRRLSEDGRHKTAAVARGLKALGITFDRAVTSPLVRARETADLVLQQAGAKVSLENCPFLEPGGDAAEAVHWLSGVGGESVLLVGHMPDLSELASQLLAGHARMDVEFKKSGVCCLSFDGPPGAGRGRLEWLMQPRHLQHMG